MQAPGVAVRQRLEQHAVDDAEDRAVGANAERERDDGDGREPGRPAQDANRVDEVLPQLADVRTARHPPREPLIDVDALALGAFVIAKLLHRAAARLVGRHALRDELADPHVEMKVELALDVGTDRRVPDRRRNMRLIDSELDAPGTGAARAENSAVA